jgi:parallel beta helix pectate lyase-like protein
MRSRSKLAFTVLAAAGFVSACGGSGGEADGPTGGGNGGASAGTMSSTTGGAGGSAGHGGGGGSDKCALPPSILEGFVAKRTLHVAPSGDDAKDGLTAATAWATLAHSADLEPGDEVEVAPGTYPCPLLGPIAGTATHPIHFVAAGAPRSAVLDCGGSGGILMQNLQYVAFDGFEIKNGMSGHCVNLFSGSGPPYDNLTEHVLFIRDYVHDCSLSAIKSSQSFEVEVRDSEIASNVTAGNPLIDFAGDHDMRVIGCDVHDSVNIGVQFKGGAYRCLAEGNRIHDVADSGIQLGEATGTPYYLPGYTDWEAKDSIAANNLLYGKMRAGVAVQGCSGCVVAHNTMWATAPAFFVRGLSTMNGTGASISDVGLVLVDNIFAGTTVPIPLNIVPPNDMGLVQGENLYFSPGGMIAGQYSDTPIGGMDNLLDVDPKFVDTTTPDLHLAAKSPAIGKAVPVPGVTRDFSGACRTDGDLGAW